MSDNFILIPPDIPMIENDKYQPKNTGFIEQWYFTSYDDVKNAIESSTT